MATYSDTIGYNRGTAAVQNRGLHKVGVYEVFLDFPAIIAARLAAGATALAAADVLEVMPIRAGSVILHAGIQVTTIDGGTSTLSLGIGGALTAFVSSGSLGTAAFLGSALADTRVFNAADTIDVTINTAVPTTAKVRVFAVVADLS